MRARKPSAPDSSRTSITEDRAEAIGRKVVVLMHGRCSANGLRAALEALGATTGTQPRVLLVEPGNGVLSSDESRAARPPRGAPWAVGVARGRRHP